MSILLQFNVMYLKTLGWFLFLTLLAAGGIFAWNQVVLPCEKPLQYSLGSFDTRFGISQAQFLNEVISAESLWEDALGKELFAFTPNAPFRVNLIFDARQEQTVEGKRLETSLHETERVRGSLAEQQAVTLASYKRASQEYEQMLASYKKQLSAYNSEVEKWNKQGGAPKDVYNNLHKVSAALDESRAQLEVKRQDVNRLATLVNSFSQKQIAVVKAYNEDVKQYVNTYGEGREFDQGEYVGQEINIYQYDDLAHLRAVLVHELGHALGLPHDNDPTSIMYHLMSAQDTAHLRLTDEDRALLFAQCRQSTWDILLQRMQLLKQRYALP